MSPIGKLDSILVATDLSDNSHEALRAAASLAEMTGAKLHVVHVEDGPGLSPEKREVLTRQRQVHTRRIALLDLLATLLPNAIGPDAARVRTGQAAEEILREAADVNADVIVVGAHRDRGFSDRFRGSTAELILRHSAVPCLVANAPLPTSIERITVPTDFSSAAQRAISAALQWSTLLGGEQPAEVTLTHVVQKDVDADDPWVGTELEADLHTAGSEAVANAQSAATFRVRVLMGADAATALIADAEASRSELMVLGTQGDGVLVRALLGSVSSALVRRAPFPLLLVPPERNPAQPPTNEATGSDTHWQEITL